MEHLEEISTEDLQKALGKVEEKKPAQRLVAAVTYKTAFHRVSLPSGTELNGNRSTIGSSDSTPTSPS